ncbi:MAG: IS3 family transposase [Bacillota bacterium]
MLPVNAFFLNLKSELVYLQNFTSLEDMIKEVENYIKFYNTGRIQLKLKKWLLLNTETILLNNPYLMSHFWGAVHAEGLF